MNLNSKLFILIGLLTFWFNNYSMEQRREKTEPETIKIELIYLLNQIEAEILKTDWAKAKHLKWPGPAIDNLLWKIDNSIRHVQIRANGIQLRLANGQIDDSYKRGDIRRLLRKTIKKINENLKNINYDFYRIGVSEFFNREIINNFKLAELCNRNHLILDGQQSTNLAVKKFYENLQDREQLEFLINTNSRVFIIFVMLIPYLSNFNIIDLECDPANVIIIKLFIIELAICFSYYFKEIWNTGEYEEI